MENEPSSSAVVESLGNKVLLEASINIRASDYRFEDKKKIYSGEIRRSRKQTKSDITEINELTKLESFNESDIMKRNKTILDAFFTRLCEEQLVS